MDGLQETQVRRMGEEVAAPRSSRKFSHGSVSGGQGGQLGCGSVAGWYKQLEKRIGVTLQPRVPHIPFLLTGHLHADLSPIRWERKTLQGVNEGRGGGEQASTLNLSVSWHRSSWETCTHLFIKKIYTFYLSYFLDDSL